MHEAATAAAQARLLMERHRIRRAALDEFDGRIFAQRDQPLWSFKRPPRWRVQLASSIARTGGCRVYLRSVHAAVEAVLVGSTEDTSDVRLLDRHLSEQISKLCQRNGRGQGRHWSHAFRLGAVATISERLTHARRQARQEATTEASTQAAREGISQALARLEARDDELDTWMARNLSLRIQRPRHIRANPHAYAQGRAAAATIPLRESTSALAG